MTTPTTPIPISEDAGVLPAEAIIQIVRELSPEQLRTFARWLDEPTGVPPADDTPDTRLCFGLLRELALYFAGLGERAQERP